MWQLYMLEKQVVGYQDMVLYFFFVRFMVLYIDIQHHLLEDQYHFRVHGHFGENIILYINQKVSGFQTTRSIVLVFIVLPATLQVFSVFSLKNRPFCYCDFSTTHDVPGKQCRIT